MKSLYNFTVQNPVQRILLAALIGLVALNPAVLAATDISNTPLATTSDITAKPNVMFILDDSGSMGWEYLPDNMGDNQTARDSWGYKSIQCNGVAFDPAYDYTTNRPVKPDGSLYPNALLSSAPTDGFQMDLSTSYDLLTPIAMGTGDRTFQVSGASSGTFVVGARVGIANVIPTPNDANPPSPNWMLGTVKSWNRPNLVVTITDVVGNASASAAWKVGPPVGVSLGNSVYHKYKGSKPRAAWKYKNDGSVDTTTDGGFANECLAAAANTSSVFDKITVNTRTATEQQNYANWYAYYRKRYLMMRSAVGRAFTPIDSKYRVGFTTINNPSAAPGDKFLEVAPFDNNQKVTFYSDLYSADVDNSTPLRGALSKIGRYFANKAPGQVHDPMEYACQRNYSILSTDGYWNTGSNTVPESGTFGPLKLDGSTNVGQQDGLEARPMWDGAAMVSTTQTPYTVVKHEKVVIATRTTTQVWTRNRYSETSSGCGFGKRRLSTQPQTYTQSTKKEKITTLQDVVGTYTRTRVTTNGTLTSDTNSSTAWGAPTITSTSSALISNVDSGAPTGATTWTDSGTATLSGTCVNTGTVAIPTPSPSTPVAPASATVSDTAPTLSTVSTDAAVAGTPGTPVISSSGGSSNSLADVSQYYYATDLRTSALGNCTGALNTDVCNNEVPISSLDRAEHQHMTTFTLGLGMNGILPYNEDYLNPNLTSGSYYDIKNGTKTWPISESNSSGITHVDDLWHAAVNGRGQYWSASDPSAVARAISAALSNVTRTIGSSSSAATSSLQPVEGRNNQVFVAKYTTKVWTGDLVSYTLDGTTGEIDTTTEVWSAAARMGSTTPSARRIYYSQPNVTTPTRREFNYANLSADGLGGNFTNFCTKPLVPGQCASLETDPKAAAENGTNLVNYLRGDGSLSSYSYTKSIVGPPASTSTETVTVYRSRESILGDIINASPVYVSTPEFEYTDAGYAAFKSAQANRSPVVMSAANDGMLHAFAAEAIGTTPAGTELWAYVPSAVMPDLYRLADTNYETNHHFFVDGTPTVADIHDGTAWKTILVGGLNAGGKSYYALDITNPTDPKVLWEFSYNASTNPNLGLTYGNPVVTKRANGDWVVVVTSGYNNTDGDGNGRLFVLNANTGQPVSDFPNGIATMTGVTTPAGTRAAPNGLAKINAWIEDTTNNTSLRFYGGDLLGNLWRFDIDSQVAPHGKALLLASFKDPSGNPQPITIKPETAVVNGEIAAVLVATGQYLGLSDIANRQVQSVYAVKDALTGTGLGDLSYTRTDIVKQTLTDAAGLTRTSTNNAVDWSTKNGWRVDLPTEGERVSVDMQLQYTTLALVSAIPGSSVCSPSGGSSWLYTFNIATGGSLTSAGGIAGNKLGNYLGVGLTWIKLTDGRSRLIIPGSNAKVTDEPVPVDLPSTETSPSGTPYSATRTSWRELVD
ncbi:pilus assembly protein [Aquabacterium sp. CECT 9606]|uniref:pilus assembly protein n=1 Tax=Aquabacterium sp. CECT 9606 TaxID=2845822 RepID=UPI001E48B8DB|nr:PilC/PilY family type IV pilus protein [Aquabacterium sp. CECT 9606]CAH0354185.1 hypothetical protein AQB9606_03573 [Aquabacterium sp. CECT 9606]